VFALSSSSTVLGLIATFSPTSLPKVLITDPSTTTTNNFPGPSMARGWLYQVGQAQEDDQVKPKAAHVA
jgi:hypothetical protein